jgi:F0F1-type ATP synthase assembly protein I
VIPPSPKIPPELGLLFTLGWSLAIWMTGGVLLGRWMDFHFGWKPWGLISGALLGVAGSGYTFYRVVRKLDKKK